MLTKPSPHFFTLLIVQPSSTQPNTCHLTSTNHTCPSKQLNDAPSSIPLKILQDIYFCRAGGVRLKKGTCAYVWFLSHSQQQQQHPLTGSHATLKTPTVPPKLHTLICNFLCTFVQPANCLSCVFVQIASLETLTVPPQPHSLT